MRISLGGAAVFAVAVGLAAVVVPGAQGISWTMVVAQPGRDVEAAVAEYHGWPKGTLAFVNLPLRTVGVHRVFSGLPNDVCTFLFRADDRADVQKLIDAFAAIESDKHVLILNPEPSAGGQFAPETAKEHAAEAAAFFAIGSQKVIDEWSKPQAEDVRGAHVALPPTLTLFLAHPAVDRGHLHIPAHVAVTDRSGEEGGAK